ncbi:hypothetical protein EVAR_34256_1 [Eumeta japonica]|uniref:Uncharacterized protein n=1 Tax=Eumeta variegata TaxID=151549 RepID=A0A4C1VXK1_EUMVA|nr:hypothetical protein EVAR_34256_1 [Eumeta japonica]
MDRTLLERPVLSFTSLLFEVSLAVFVDFKSLVVTNEDERDYRVPPPTNPSDIVESVDMELSEDEEQSMQQLAYPNQIIQNASQQHTPYNQSAQNYKQEDQRRQNFTQNNKLLTGIGRNNGKDKGERHNLIRINSFPSEENKYDKQEKQLAEPSSAPPQVQQNFQYHGVGENYSQNYPENSRNVYDSIEEAVKMMDDNNSNDSAYEDDPRQRYEMVRNPSPPDVHWSSSDGDWMRNRGAYMNQMNPRFQRNWNPVMRNNFRPTGFPHFRPRNGPRPPNRPWLGPRAPRGHW